MEKGEEGRGWRRGEDGEGGEGGGWRRGEEGGGWRREDIIFPCVKPFEIPLHFCQC